MFKLYNYYATLSLLAFVLVVGPYSYFFAHHISSQTYEAQLNQNLLIGKLFISENSDYINTLSTLDSSDLENLQTSQGFKDFQQHATRLAATSELSQIRLINPSGNILYSLDLTELGQMLAQNKLAKARQAHIEGLMSGSSQTTTNGVSAHILSSYLALKPFSGGNAVLEISSDISAAQAQIEAFRFWFILLTVLCALVLYLMLLAFMKYFTGIINKQYEELTLSHAKLERQAEELRRSNEELELFAYTASHDLQEPLRKVQAFGERLAKKHGDVLGKEGLLYLERMQDASSRMRVLIQDLLTYSRVSTKVEPFVRLDLNLIVRDVISDLEVRIAQSGGQVNLSQLPVLDADPLQMRQLFQNLIGNALKFHKPDLAPIVTVSCEQMAEQALITVKDNGVGFDNQYAEKVFQIFQRLHGRGEYEGTGMGLAIVRKIVERHGGSIRAESVTGEGASFIITLPLPKTQVAETKKDVRKSQTLHPQLT